MSSEKAEHMIVKTWTADNIKWANIRRSDWKNSRTMANAKAEQIIREEGWVADGEPEAKRGICTQRYILPDRRKYLRNKIPSSRLGAFKTGRLT